MAIHFFLPPEGQKQRDHVFLALPEVQIPGSPEGQRQRDHDFVLPAAQSPWITARGTGDVRQVGLSRGR